MNNNTELTPRQSDILEVVRSYVQENNCPPTEREISARVGISRNAVRRHLATLAERGHILAGEKGRKRQLQLAQMPRMVSVPVVGSVRAGQPLLAIEHQEGMMAVDANLLGRGREAKEAFLLRVRGDSMIDAGIEEDDLVLVRRAERVRNGEIIVARIGDETTVKRFYRIAGTVILEPANKQHQPIVVKDPQELTIEGRVVALIRSFNPGPVSGMRVQ